MKYIDAEKLKAEIERLTNQKKEKLKWFSDEDYTCSVASSINCKLCGNEEVLSIIKSLQQEQPEMDLEKEIEQVVENYNSLINGSKVMKPSGVEKIARHFYELGLKARKEENK